MAYAKPWQSDDDQPKLIISDFNSTPRRLHNR
jgi:hypothetical protein